MPSAGFELSGHNVGAALHCGWRAGLDRRAADFTKSAKVEALHSPYSNGRAQQAEHVGCLLLRAPPRLESVAGNMHGVAYSHALLAAARQRSRPAVVRIHCAAKGGVKLRCVTDHLAG